MKRLIFILLLLITIIACSKKRDQTTNVFYEKAFKFRDTLKAYDSAYYYFNKAKDIFLQKKDKLGVGRCLLNMGYIAKEKGDYFNGQELSLSAMPYFDENNKDQHKYISSNFSNLGTVTEKLNDYENALKFYSNAAKFAITPSERLLNLNNKAYAYQELKRYDIALKIFSDILREKLTPEEYARTLNNFAVTKYLQDSTYNPLPSLLKALEIRKSVQDWEGQNSSCWYLSEYYGKISKIDSAMFYAEEMFRAAQKIENPNDQLLAIEKLTLFSPIKSTKDYFKKYQKLNDSLQLARNKAKNQFAVIRYDAEKHKAESLKLQKDNTEKTYQIIFLATGSAVLLIAGTFWYRKRKQRLEMEKENAIKESRLKTSKKVHDVVANGLYRVMNKIEYQPELDKEVLLDEIEDLYEKSRDISYEKPLAPTAHFHQKIANLIYSFNTDQIEVHLMGNTAALWNKVELTAKDEVIHILQELLVNMRKHSQASEVTLQFTKTEHELHIIYEDNGIGIKGEVKSNNGLRNTETRIKNLNGQITFETGSEKGLSINFSFPVSSKT